MTGSGTHPQTATWQYRPSDGERDAERPLSQRPGDGSVARADLQRDATVRRWGPVTPAATQIGRAESPEADLKESVRRLHEERHSATAGHGERMARLDKLRIAHALANDLSLTPWQRDRVVGVMADLDLTAFGSQRAIPTVALVVIRHVVDRERERYLGLHDTEWIRDLPPERLEALYDQFDSITDDPEFSALAAEHGLDITSLNRLRRVLTDQLEARELEDAVYGRNPHRDPNLPSVEARRPDE
ncbi:Nif11-like leader peptide family natural product precursor [Halorussus salilacus]|uniref:Nif11-like leader peptide family natural product precursor n=1 Tax=Halorussus salilacus TaxID=2953750 RepID=UPI0020A18A64|nr:Nif11-like leader peptide family natural product precursor [Halorussus salilacus]USZ68349.1 Nif11-like leader peptide family natural product precursor [Halorussus salilacus]